MQMATSLPEPDAADKDFFQKLRRELEHQISGYVYEVPEGTIGSTLPADQIRGYLNSMRLCLVEPHWEEVNVCNTSEESWAGAGVKRMCVTMAEDKGYVLVFDPVDVQYHLAWRSEHGLGTWGIRGDGVGCFNCPIVAGRLLAVWKYIANCLESHDFGKLPGGANRGVELTANHVDEMVGRLILSSRRGLCWQVQERTIHMQICSVGSRGGIAPNSGSGVAP